MSLPLTHAGLSAPGISAALDLKFASTLSLTSSSGITPSFSRASTGSFFDSAGVLRYAPLNLALYSSDFSNVYWSAASGTSKTPNYGVDPNGGNTACRITGNGYFQSSGITKSAGTYTLSLWVKSTSGSSTNIRIFIDGGFTTQTIAVTGSWTRVSMTQTFATSNSAAIGIYSDSSDILIWGVQLEASSTVGTYVPTTSAANSAPRFDYTYNGTSWVSRGLLVEEQRTNYSEYSESIGSWTQDGATTSSDQGVSPDGTSNADLVSETTSNSYHAVYNASGGSVTAGQTWTQSLFVKKGNGASAPDIVQLTHFGTPFGSSQYCNFNISTGVIVASTGGTGTITNCGNGWYRITWTATAVLSGPAGVLLFFTNNNGSATRVPSYTGSTSANVYAFGGQVELGSFATSYIRNVSSGSTTRSADVCQITGSDFSSFWNSSEGSFCAEGDFIGVESSNDRYLFAASNSSNTFIVCGTNVNSAGNFGSNAYSVGSLQFEFNNSSNPSANSSIKYALGLKLNDFASSLNGSSVLTDISGTIPTSSGLGIGQLIPFGRQMCGHIARLRYFNRRLTDKQLEDLCKPEEQLKLDLKFSENLSLTPVVGPTPSFSRASTGSYFDSTGTLKYANVNLITWSEDFTQAAWNGGSTSRTANTAIAPNGSLTADTITFNGGSQIYHATTGSSAVQTFSAYFKKIDHRYISMQIETGVSAYRAVFDLDTSSVTDTNASTTASITSIGSGWFRCSVTNTSTASSTVWYTIQQSATATFSTGIGLKNFYIWGAQAEIGSSATQYAKTSGSTTAGPRFDHTYDGTNWVSRGILIEEQRTNLLLYSEDISYGGWTKTDSSVSVNAGTAPDGSATADKLIENSAATVAHRMYYYLPMGTSSSFSAFFKAAGRNYVMMMIYAGSTAKLAYFDILNGSVVSTNTPQITARVDKAGNGWFRCSVTYSGVDPSSYVQIHMSPNGITDTYTGDGASGMFIWGLQAENGVAFPTSYIPTTSSSVVRSADVCQITGTDFSGIWNQGEGAIVDEYDLIGMAASTFGMAWQADDNTLNNRIVQIGYENSGVSIIYQPGIYVATSGTGQANMYGPTFGINTLKKTGFAWRANDFALTVDGGAVSADTSGTIPATTQINIGRRISDGYLNGHISRLRYYAIRLPNRLLIAKSQ